LQHFLSLLRGEEIMAGHEEPKVASHTTRAKEPRIVQEGQKPINVIRGVFLFLALGMIAVMIIFYFRGCDQRKVAKQQEAAEIRAAWTAQEQAVAAQEAPPASKQMTYFYRDWPNECVEVRIEAYEFGANLLGKGGEAMVHPPHGAKPFLASPGEKFPTNHKPGWWRFCKVSPSAEGVEIEEHFSR